MPHLINVKYKSSIQFLLFIVYSLIMIQGQGIEKDGRNFQGCEIPYMNPFDGSVTKYLTNLRSLRCTGNYLPIVTSNITHLIIIKKNWNMYNTSPYILSCFYTPFRKKAHGDCYSVEYRKDPIVLDKSQKIKYEYVRVQCYLAFNVVYDDFFSFIQAKYKNDSNNKEQLNVIVVGLDNVSRLNFRRTMPKTLNYLIKNLKAIEFVNYNKIGENTFPNLISMLTGYSVKELEKNCWNGSNFDNCTFIWDKFNDIGYVTAYGEDTTKLSLFNYFGEGFITQPTTHDWTTFIAAAELEFGIREKLNTYLCLSNRPVYQTLLDYSLNFIISYHRVNQRFFGFFWQNSLTHDYLNYPSVGDINYRDYLKQLEEAKVLNNSVLIVLSDHGMRWGSILSVHQGLMEVNLPMLYIVLPEWFYKKYPKSAKNIKENASKLTTPFDLYKTLKDIANNNFNIDNLKKRTRGISLFRPIPSSRLCKTAQIPSEFCACQQKFPLPISNETVSKAVYCIIEFLNKKLKKYPLCAQLSVSKIIKAEYSKSFDLLKNGQIFKFYTVEIEFYPGNGVFVSSVKCLKCEDYDDFVINGPVIRKNVNSARSFCVSNTKIKPYCHCK